VGWASYGLACLGCCSNTSSLLKKHLFFYKAKVAPHSLARDLATSPCIFHRPIFYRAIQKRPLHLPDPSSQTRPSRRLPFLAAAAPAGLSTSYAYTSVLVPLSAMALVRTLTPSTAKQGGGHPRSDGDTSGKTQPEMVACASGLDGGVHATRYATSGSALQLPRKGHGLTPGCSPSHIADGQRSRS
jgi:hypothetical protein